MGFYRSPPFHAIPSLYVTVHSGLTTTFPLPRRRLLTRGNKVQITITNTLEIGLDVLFTSEISRFTFYNGRLTFVLFGVREYFY